MFEDMSLEHLQIAKDRLLVALATVNARIREEKASRGAGRPNLGKTKRAELVRQFRRNHMVDKRMSYINRYQFIEANPRFKHPVSGAHLGFDTAARKAFIEEHGFDPLESTHNWGDHIPEHQ